MNMEVGSIEFVWKGVKSFPIREEAQRLKTPQKSAPVPQRSPSPFNQSAADEDEPDIEEVLRVHRAVSDIYTPPDNTSLPLPPVSLTSLTPTTLTGQQFRTP